jgi:PAS domain S-box-containing protein
MAHQAMYTILIVDDNPHNLFTLRTLLQANLDTDVIEAESGLAALEKISQQKIDLILLDIQMPGLDGFETAKLIRNRKRFQDIPIIFLTAIYKSEEFKEKGLAGGAIDYLTKPIDETMLINRVKAYLRLLENERAINRQLEDMNKKLQDEIEERKRMERTLAEERNLLRTLIDNLPNLIYVKDLQNRFLTANKAAIASLGLTTQDELLGKTDFDLHPHNLAEQYAAEEAEDAVKEAQKAKEEAQEKAGEVQWANARLEEQQQQLQQQSEELQQINAHLEEQQQQVQQQREELRQQNENLRLAKEELDYRTQELESAGRDKVELLSKMSHELRTPLNSIILVSKMLSKNEKNHFDDKDVKQLKVIQQAGGV